MKSKVITPDHSISAYVSSVLVIENYGQTGDFFLPLYANGCPTLVFNTSKAISKNKTVNHLTLYGQTIQASDLSIRENFTLIAYLLNPCALTSLFGIKATELTNERLELSVFKEAKVHSLEEQLLNTPALNSRLELLNTFIRTLAGKSILFDPRAEFATQAIARSKGEVSLFELQCQLGITERTLQRIFEANVGISPKMYSRVCQFQQAFRQLNQLQVSKVSDVAYEYGFADQSHFTRVFKEFTNLSPKVYLRNLRALALEI